MKLFWFIPTHGDGRYLGSAHLGRSTALPYLRQIAQAADDLGFHGVLIPTGRSCDDPWVVASALAAVTTRLRFLVAVRPGLMLPSVAARMTATLDRISAGRLLINVVAGGDPIELHGDGIFDDHDTRYAITDEFLDVWRQLLGGASVDYAGSHLRISGGRVLFPAVQQPHPEVYFGGSSAAGHVIAAKHADVYLSWGEPPELVAQKVAEVREAAARTGRRLRFGMRLHIIVRETAQEAWADADRLISRISDEAIANAQRTFARFDSAGQRRMSQLHGGRRDRLEVSPNLWAGIGLVRGGAGTALVGDPRQIAERLREYEALGIEEFILSGYPHLEEAYRTAELLFPEVGADAATARGPQAGYTSPFGEIVANQDFPQPAVPAH